MNVATCLAVPLLALCSSPLSAQITEDHRFSPPAWVTPGRFGDHTHTSEDGRTVLALAYLQGGVAFHRTGTGEWVDYPLIPSIGGGPQQVSLSGDGRTALVSSKSLRAGAVTVFRFTGSEWTEEAVLQPTDVGSPIGYEFGLRTALSYDGSLALISKGQYGDRLAFIYAADDEGEWEEVARLREPEPGYNLEAVISLSGDGSTAAITAFTPDFTTAKVSVFRRADPDGQEWLHDASLPPPPGASGDFGVSTALSADGNLLLVGDHNYANSGAVFVYRRTGNGEWSEEAVLRGSDYGFGYDVALTPDGTGAFVLAGHDDGGRVYVFAGQGGEWSEVGYLIASDPGPNHDEPYYVSAGDSTAVVGWPTLEAVFFYDFSLGTAAAEPPPDVSTPGRLSPVRPNPFEAAAEVMMHLDRQEHVEAVLYDALGRVMARPFSGLAPSGETMLSIGGARLAPGLYLLRVSGDGWQETRRIVRAGR